MKNDFIPDTLWDQVKSEVIPYLKKMDLGPPGPQKCAITLKNTKLFCPISKIESNDNVFYAMTQEELFAPFLTKKPELTNKIQVLCFKKGGDIIITNIFIGDTIPPQLPWDLSVADSQDPERMHAQAKSFWNNHAYNSHVVQYDKKTVTQVNPV
ncbi:hypothetical protein KA405_00690 [Patescibacteria group bacterium]|nr:hypothetical protein [Patescibacteria group bacterium]